MATLPSFNTDILELSLMQSKWASQIEPVLSKPWNSGLILKNVSLATGANMINHKLQRKLQGWIPIRFQGVWAQIYDNQNLNQSPELTLSLVSSAPVMVDLIVF